MEACFLVPKSCRTQAFIHTTDLKIFCQNDQFISIQVELSINYIQNIMTKLCYEEYL